MKHELQEMLRQHAELRALAQDYERELARPLPDLQALAKCRWTLARLTAAHLAYEGLHLYPVLNRIGGHAGDVSRALSVEMADLGAQLGEHVRNWTSDLIMSDWTGFSRSSTALMIDLKARMDREEAEAYPLLNDAKAA